MRCRTLASALFLFAALPAQTEQAARPGKIEGIVTGANQEPVPVADVWVVVDGQEVARIKADGSGFFALQRLPLGPLIILATREDRSIGHAYVSLTREQVHAEVRITVLPAGTVRGRVFDPDGEPIPGAHVVVSPTASSTADTFDVTDDQGRFTLEHIPLGRAHLWVVVRGFDMEQRACDVPDDMEQTFRLERAEDEPAYQGLRKVLERVTVRPYRWSNGPRNGIQIVNIDPDLGKRIGLRSGDVVLQVNGVPVLTWAQALETVTSFHSRGIITFHIRLMTMGRIESRVYVAPAK